jgi:hypothetical protein
MVLLLVSGSSLAAQPPNIVLIIGDDHGWPYSGFMGDPQIQTPNLDQLAETGTVFTNTHVPAPICKPSLRTLLSGLNPTQWDAKKRDLELAVGSIPFGQEVRHYRTLPRELQHVGYKSWEGGKMFERGGFWNAGFTDGLAKPPSTGVSFGRKDWDTSQCGPTGDQDIPCPALNPLREFLDEIEDIPFCLWFAPILPHTPFNAPNAYRSIYFHLLPSLPDGLSAPEEILAYIQENWSDSEIEELFRVSVDPFERNDLAASRPELLAAFRDDVVAWGAEIETPPDRLEAAGQLVDDLAQPIAGRLWSSGACPLTSRC